jgi:hypothetical protein
MDANANGDGINCMPIGGKGAGAHNQGEELPSWVYINGLGEREPDAITEQDTLTSMAFDGTGDYLAVGDRAGRVIVFKHSGPIKNSRYFDYRYFAEI